jgi:demethylmenaquinone methyltransferase/2-methoxy-6-polyprenyl-1,4-benzoquinol methylase
MRCRCKTMEDDQILKEQVEYYQARAIEYDEWFLRQGRYDRGPEHRAACFSELALVEAALHRELQSGEGGLELACGTGQSLMLTVNFGR